MDDSPSNPMRSLVRALDSHPQQVEAVPVRQLLLDSAREKARRPAYLKLAVPDRVVQSVRGSADSGDLVLLVRVPREVLDREESRIVLPGELSGPSNP